MQHVSLGFGEFRELHTQQQVFKSENSAKNRILMSDTEMTTVIVKISPLPSHRQKPQIHGILKKTIFFCNFYRKRTYLHWAFSCLDPSLSEFP